MTPEQLRAHRRPLMDHGEHPGICLFAPDVPAGDLRDLVTLITAREDLRESILRGES